MPASGPKRIARRTSPTRPLSLGRAPNHAQVPEGFGRGAPIPEAFGRGDAARGKASADAQAKEKAGNNREADRPSPGRKQDEKPHKEQDHEPSNPPFYRRPVLMTIIAVVVVAVIVGGLLFWLHSRHFEKTDDAYIDGHIVPISPHVQAIVKDVLVDDNKPVRKGDLLMRLDEKDFKVVLDQMTANEASARGKVAQAQTSLEAAQANVGQARAELVVAQANAEQLHQDRIVAHLTPYDTAYQHAVHAATQPMMHGGTPPGIAQGQALGSIYQTMLSQAQQLSYIDIFEMLAIGSLAAILLALMLKKMKLGEGGAHGAA